MLGAAGALCCLMAGTAAGGWMNACRTVRLEMLCAVLDVLHSMRMLLETERLSLPELLKASAEYAGTGEGARVVQKRWETAAEQLRTEPLTEIAAAYASASRQHPLAWEQAEEKQALESLFSQLGMGTAAMREQSVAACIRRLKPLCEKAHAEAERSGKLCIQLGMLLGLMAGIVLW